LNSTGTKVWLDSTFGGDAGYGLAIDPAWNAYVVGTSNAGEYFPLTSNAYQSSFKSAASQGFLAKLIIEADVKAIQSASPNPVTHGTSLTYTLSVFNNGPDVSDGDTITDVLPTGTTFVSFRTTNGSCSHPTPGSGGTFKCTRTGVLNKGSYWGPIKLTVHVNSSSGSTINNTASVAAKTQDVVPSNNSATVSVHVQ
jgi:large repetitive protein